MAQRAGQRAAAHRRAAPWPRPASQAGDGPVESGWARRIRAALPRGTIRRHAAKGRDHARAYPRPGDAADGRAVRRARRDDARADESGASTRLARAEKDRAFHHPLNRRGGLSCRPGPCVDASSRSPHGGCAGKDPAPARAGNHELPRVRRLRPFDSGAVQRERGDRRIKSIRDIAFTILLFCASILAWEGIVRIFEVPTFIFPAPSKVAAALWNGFASGLYQKHLSHTLLETLLGFLLGSALGFFLGAAVALNRYVEYFFYPYIVMFQSLPKVALAPLIVVWFGLGLKSQVVNAALVAFFPLLVNTIVGLKSADEDRMNLMRSLAASENQIFWMLKLPNALPFVMAGLDVAMIFALIGAIVAEFVGARAGLGMLIQSMNFNMDVSGQFSVLLILSIVGLLLNRCILLIRRRVLFWDPSEKERLERERIAL